MAVAVIGPIPGIARSCRHTSRQRVEVRLRILQDFRQLPAQVAQPPGDDQAVFAQQTPGLIGHRRALFDQVLTDALQHLNVLLLGTLQGQKCMLGRPTASQMASASFASFLLPFTYGLTNCGAIKRTSCPSLISSRAQ